MIRKILKVFGLALYSDLKEERQIRKTADEDYGHAFHRIKSAQEYINRQKSQENGVVYLSDEEQTVLTYILMNEEDDTIDKYQRIENAEDFVKAHK